MKKVLLITFLFTVSLFLNAQFEESALNVDGFEKVNAWIEADFALQFQAIDHVGKLANGNDFMPLGSYINLPTANFIVHGELAPGIRVSLETYLSSRHHNEAWVKGGYLIVDHLPFLSKESNKLMNYLTMKVGVMELNYGDGHFRRSDNGDVLKNAFVGNYIMDAFTTAPAMEIIFRNKGIIGMAGLTTGNLKPELTGFSDNKDSVINALDFIPYDLSKEIAFYGKIGYDRKLTDELRVRLTLSPYYQSYSHRGTLWSGDRAGARFYSVLVPASNGAAATDIKLNSTNGRWGPGATKSVAALMLNPFLKYKGLEIFGLYELASGKTTSGSDFAFNHWALEALYRLGKTEQYYIGAKYNSVSNSTNENANRMEVAAGWFITPNIIAKLEYVTQTYHINLYEPGTGFNGFMLEAAISF